MSDGFINPCADPDVAIMMVIVIYTTRNGNQGSSEMTAPLMSNTDSASVTNELLSIW
jgi:hypothetical protein